MPSVIDGSLLFAMSGTTILMMKPKPPFKPTDYYIHIVTEPDVQYRVIHVPLEVKLH